MEKPVIPKIIYLRKENEYPQSYECGNCGNTLELNSMSCEKCFSVVDWQSVGRNPYGT